MLQLWHSWWIESDSDSPQGLTATAWIQWQLSLEHYSDSIWSCASNGQTNCWVCSQIIALISWEQSNLTSSFLPSQLLLLHLSAANHPCILQPKLAQPNLYKTFSRAGEFSLTIKLAAHWTFSITTKQILAHLLHILFCSLFLFSK